MNGRNADGTFTTGNAGKPRGTRNKVTQAVLGLLEGQAEALTQRAVQMALGRATAGPCSFAAPINCRVRCRDGKMCDDDKRANALDNTPKAAMNKRRYPQHSENRHSAEPTGGALHYSSRSPSPIQYTILNEHFQFLWGIGGHDLKGVLGDRFRRRPI